jgi:fatty acid desaturase
VLRCPTLFEDTVKSMLTVNTSWPGTIRLAEDVRVHRLNTRTVYLNRINRYLYWNMGYHIEHPMFPMVPYYNLGRLYELMQADTPPT